MRTTKALIMVAILGTCFGAGLAEGKPCFGYRPAWVSADERSTLWVALADFNGDGWQYEVAETRDGDGVSHVYYLKHWPALTITKIKINGQVIPRDEYCFDARAGWFSFKNVPAYGTLIAVDYVWSNRLDLFAANEQRTETDGRNAIYFNDNGTLERFPGWLSDDEEREWSLAVADFDADGDVDVAAASADYIKVYSNTGSGLETTASWRYDITPAWYYFGLAWGDVDNDGYLELAAVDWVRDRLSVFKNNGGTLESSPSWEAVGYEVSPTWGDVDGDGDMDLAVATHFSNPPERGRAFVFRNVGGALEAEPYWMSDGPEAKCLAMAWGDVNGDGWLDLIKGIHGGGSVTDMYADIYFSQDGVLPVTPSWESEYYAYNYNSCLVDADRDGSMDLIQSSLSGVIGYFGKGGTLETTPSWDYVPGLPFFVFAAAVGDVNADGYVDVAVGRTTSSGGARGATNALILNKANIGINVRGFAASACERGVALRWDVSEAVAGFNLYREVKSAEAATEPAKINEGLITGRSPYRFLDDNVAPGNTYIYWLDVVPLSGPAERHGPAECTAGVKTSFALAQNRPNPARTATTFAFSLPAACDATLTVFDLAGRKVATPYAGRAAAGTNELAVDVSTLAPGVYTYRLEADGASATKKMVVVR